MALSQLSVELIQIIMKEAIPEGFDGLAMSCKYMYGASRIYAQEHNEMKRKWNRVSFMAYDDGHKVARSSPLKLLIAIAEEPMIARYIKYADFRMELPYTHGYRGVFRLDLNASRSPSISKVVKLIEQSAYIRDAQEDPTAWAESLCMRVSPDERGDLAIAFLLTLLQNVVELTFPLQFLYEEHPKVSGRNLLRAISRNANQLKHQHPSPALSILNTLNPGQGTGDRALNEPVNFASLLTIESLRKFRCGCCEIWEQASLESSFLQEIDLAGCSASGKEISKLLSCTRLLKRFRFSYETRGGKRRSRWDCKAFVAAVEGLVGNSLEDLSLSILGPANLENGITAMKGFKQLRRLELDIRLILGRRAKNRMWELGDDLQPPIPILVDLLPYSVAKLQLLADNGYKSVECMMRLFHNFKNWQPALPNLSAVEIRCLWQYMVSRHDGLSSKKEEKWQTPLLKSLSCLGSTTLDLVDISGNFEYERAAFMRAFYQRFDVQHDRW